MVYRARKYTISYEPQNIFEEGIFAKLSRNQKFGFSQDLIRSLDRTNATISHNGCINTAQWNKSGELLVTGSDDRNLKIWKLGNDFNTIELKHAHLTRHRGNIFCADFDRLDSDILYSVAADGALRSNCLSNPNVGNLLHSSESIM
jgi:WD40 repeat protein